jgi:transcriptional regulator with XRE-family HTH domain
MSMSDAAKALDVAPGYLSLLEREHASPGRDLLFRMSALYLVSVEWIETGRLASEDQAKLARFDLWPELLYVIANHVVVPRIADPATFLPDDDGIRAAIARAWAARHWCEFWDWATSADGRKTAKGFAGRGSIEELVERTDVRPMPPDSALTGRCHDSRWIALSNRHVVPGRNPQNHCSAAGTCVGKTAWDCFLFDARTCGKLYEAFGFGSGAYGIDGPVFRSPFVRQAFPPVFWSAAKRWADRRLAGWFWYLEMPADLFGPLVAVARSYSSPEAFQRGSHRLLEQADIQHMEVFLSPFIDIGAQDLPYRLKYREAPLCESLRVVTGEARGGFALPRGRRIAYTMLPDSVRLELIHDQGDEKLKAEVRAFLERKAQEAAPHTFKDDCTIQVAHEGWPARRDPRLDQKPPEALP